MGLHPRPGRPDPRRLLIASSLIAATTIVAGCGSTGSPGSSGSTGSSGAGSSDVDGQVLAAAYTATTGARTARVQIRTSVQAKGTGASLNSSNTSDGILNLANGDRDITTQLPTGGQTESRRVAGVVYSKVAIIGNAPPPTKPWIKVTITGAAANSTTDDPTQALSYLRAAARSISKVGTEQVRGQDTTHYKAEIDLAKLATAGGQTPPPGQPDAGEALRRLLGRDTLPVEIWVDAQQRICRIQTVSPIVSGSASGGSGSASSTAAPSATPTNSGTATIIEEFYDFGAPADIQAPPADQVSDAPVRVSPAPSGSAPAPAATSTGTQTPAAS